MKRILMILLFAAGLYAWLMLLFGCATPPAAKVETRTVAKVATAERWVFIHAYWYSAEFYQNLVRQGFTGVFIVALPGQEGDTAVDVARARAAGLQVATGVWVSQPDGTPEGRAMLLSREFHQERVMAALATGDGALVIDPEPYRDPDWFSPWSDWPELLIATEPWGLTHGRTLYLLTGGSGSSFQMTLAIAHNAAAGGAHVVLCDEWTYWCSAADEARYRSATLARRYGYLPGYVAGALRDRRYTARIAAGPCWFYPRSGVDDLRTGTYGPVLPYVVADCNCDGVTDFSDISPFVLAVSSPDAYAATWPGCPSLNADCDHDGTLGPRDVRALVALLSTPR